MSALAAGWAQAESVDADSIASLEARVSEYETMMRSGEIAGVYDFLPPPLLKAICKQVGMTEAELRAATGERFRGVLNQSDFDGIEFSFGLENAQFETSSTGRAVAVTQSRMAAPGLPELRIPVAALVDHGTWYLVRIDTPGQQELLTGIYPDLADLDVWR
jgi:hypothetical protein